MSDKVWIETPEGEQILVSYDELDPEVLGQFCKPTGKFSYSAQNFLNAPLAEVPFYLQDWLPVQGKMMIYGQNKAGKSFLAVQIARTIAAGEPLFGMPTRQGRVLYLQFELGASVLQRRMRLTKQNYDEVYVGTTFALKLDKPSGQKALLDELDAIHPQVLILDPLYKILDGDENESKDVLILLDFIDTVLDAYSADRLSVLILHHPGKDLSRGGRGSSVLEGWVDANVEMRRISNEEGVVRARLTPKALRHAQIGKPIDIVLGENFEFQVGESPETVKDKVLHFFQREHRARMQEVLDQGIGSRRSVYDARRDLLNAEKIVNAGDGYYMIKEDIC